MTDPRGYQEIKFKTGKHRLHFKKWDIAELEDVAGISAVVLLSDPNRFGFKQICQAIAIGLKHEDEEITAERVSELMDDGEYLYYMKAVVDSIKPMLLKVPEPKSNAGANGKESSDVPLPETNTGDESSS